MELKYERSVHIRQLPWIHFPLGATFTALLIENNGGEQQFTGSAASMKKDAEMRVEKSTKYILILLTVTVCSILFSC